MKEAVTLTSPTWTWLRLMYLDTRVAERARPCLDVSFQLPRIVVAGKTELEIFQLLPFLLLDLQGDQAASVEEEADGFEILCGAATCCHRRGTNADSAWGEG